MIRRLSELSHLGSPPRACGEMGSGDGDVRGSSGSIDRHSVWDVSVEELHLTVNAQVRYFCSSCSCLGLRGGREPSGIMCIEVALNQSIIGEGKEAGEVGGIIGLEGTGVGDVDVDKYQLHPVHLDNNSLVLQVRIIWEQVGQVVLSV